MRDRGDIPHDYSSHKWHPWTDKPGIVRTPVAWNDAHLSTVSGIPWARFVSQDDAIHSIAHNELFVLCQDILSPHDIPWGNDMLGDDSCIPYVSRQGYIAALHIKEKKHSGFLIPSHTWKWDDLPSKQLLENLITVWERFGFQAATPSSLSEKVLRKTLPIGLNIYRPSVMIRRDILNNHTGGRIDQAEKPYRFYRKVKEFDKNKAYCWHARMVPSPFSAPFLYAHPDLSEIGECDTGFWHTHLIAHTYPLCPIQVEGRTPKEGEEIDRWLWTGELMDCLEAGYTLLEITGGYGWKHLSNFMEEWSDILYKEWEKAENDHPHIREVIKAMMVGLPGRFLRKPEQFRLIPLVEMDTAKGDTALLMHWQKEGDQIFSNYAIRGEYDKESTALSYIGSYIVAEMRRELYHRMKEEEKHGYRVIRSYIDCYAIADDCRLDDMPRYRDIGTGLGQWKERQYSNVLAEENRFIGIDERGLAEMKAPGFAPGSEKSLAFWRRYWQKEHLPF